MLLKVQEKVLVTKGQQHMLKISTQQPTSYSLIGCKLSQSLTSRREGSMGWTVLLGTHSVSPWSRKKTSDWYLSTVTTRPRYHLAVSTSNRKKIEDLRTWVSRTQARSREGQTQSRVLYINEHSIEVMNRNIYSQDHGLESKSQSTSLAPLALFYKFFGFALTTIHKRKYP